MTIKTRKLWSAIVTFATCMIMLSCTLAADYPSPAFHLPEVGEETDVTSETEKPQEVMPVDEGTETSVPTEMISEATEAPDTTPAPTEVLTKATEVPEVTDEPAVTVAPDESDKPVETKVPEENVDIDPVVTTEEPETTKEPQEEETTEIADQPEDTEIPQSSEQPEGTAEPEDTVQPQDTEEPAATDIPETTVEPAEQTGVSFEKDSNGNLILDENGNPIPQLSDTDDIPVKYMRDANGKLILDANGNPIPTQWVPAGSTVMYDLADQLDPNRSIKVYIDLGPGQLYFGDTISFYAVLNGYDNAVYTLQWQTSKDNEHWTDVPNENGIRMDLVVTEDNYQNWWRISVNITEVVAE